MTADERSDLEHLRADLQRICAIKWTCYGHVCWRTPDVGELCWIVVPGDIVTVITLDTRDRFEASAVVGRGGDIVQAARRLEAAHRAFMEGA